jgi:YidC/Oxa1 family membrane protein insertase
LDRNFLLAIALSFLVLSLWTLYTGGPQGPQNIPPEGDEARAVEPLEREPRATAAFPEAVEPPNDAAPRVATEPERLFRVETPLYEAVFTSRGGALLHWSLRDYDDAELPGRPLVEITTLDPSRDVALGTPFESIGFGDLSLAAFDLEQPDPLTLVFSRKEQGVLLRKTYRLKEDDYLFRLLIDVENDGDRHVRPTFRTVWPARKQATVDFLQHELAAFADGDLEQVLVGGGAGFLGFGGGDLSEPRKFPSDVDWAGANTTYFLAAMMPDVPRDAAARFSSGRERDLVYAEVAFQAVNVPPGQSASRELRVYLGPKETARLEAAGSRLDESIRKGWFPPLTSFFVWLLQTTYGVVGNYGVAIILITVLVRVLMFPIMQKQVKSMKRMGDMQPRMKEIQEKYADDKQKQSEEMMKLWKESGFNPMAGCLPMVLQLPVFIGLYYALQGAIELRQAPFFGWMNDLSAPETLFVLPGLDLPVRLLPLLMGGSMVLQQRLTPTTMDPAQARMMGTVMPVMFTFLFYQFASGLVLYWLISNVLGIAQQLWTNRRKEATA